MMRSRSTKLSVFIILAISLIAVPLAIDRWLLVRAKHYDDLVRSYECKQVDCAADFNGDGIAGHLEQKPISSDCLCPTVFAIDGGEEYPLDDYEIVDNTLKTHIALRQEASGVRVLVFDGTRDNFSRNTPIYAAFAWNGQEMVQTQPTEADLEILSAMAAHDYAGTLYQWELYESLRLYVLVGYYALLIGVIALMSRSSIRRVTKSLP